MSSMKQYAATLYMDSGDGERPPNCTWVAKCGLLISQSRSDIDVEGVGRSYNHTEAWINSSEIGHSAGPNQHDHIQTTNHTRVCSNLVLENCAQRNHQIAFFCRNHKHRKRRRKAPTCTEQCREPRRSPNCRGNAGRSLQRTASRLCDRRPLRCVWVP
jgi:hypothetical protein